MHISQSEGAMLLRARSSGTVSRTDNWQPLSCCGGRAVDISRVFFYKKDVFSSHEDPRNKRFHRFENLVSKIIFAKVRNFCKHKIITLKSSMCHVSVHGPNSVLCSERLETLRWFFSGPTLSYNVSIMQLCSYTLFLYYKKHVRIFLNMNALTKHNGNKCVLPKHSQNLS